MYTVTFENGFKTTVDAEDMRAIELQMFDKYGVDAIGMSIVGDNGNFHFGVCQDSWKRVLAEYFPKFTMQDVLNHLRTVAYAWLNFDKVEDYDYYEDCKTIHLCDEGLEYIHNNDALSVEMDRIDLYW